MKKYYSLLIVIPLFYFILGSYFHQIVGYYSISSSDPEYIYYLNGLTIANGKMDVGNIDHPGIPFDYLMAASIKITHFFRLHVAGLNEDALANSDMYLRVANLALIILIAGIVYAAGRISMAITPNFWYAFIIQFSPFATEIIYGNLGRLVTETFIPIPVIFLTLLLLKFILNPEKPITRKDIFLLAIILAFALSIKLTLAPLLVLPFIIIPKWKDKAIFTILTLILFLIISIPVTLQLDYFWRWIKGLFLFSGKYGMGDKNIVNTNEFIPNILNLFNTNKQFFYFAFLFIFMALVTILVKKGETKKINNKISIAVFVIVLIQVLALGKHFKTPYFIPALMLLPIMAILSVEYLKLWLPLNLMKYLAPVYISIVLSATLIAQWPSIQSLSIHFDKRNRELMKSYSYFKTVEDDCIKIIVPEFYGAPIPEFALMTSYQWTGKHKEFFKPYLSKLYPNSYILYTWDKTLNFWGNEISITGEKPVYIYFGDISYRETLKDELAKYLPENYTMSQVFFNDETQEVIYRLN